MFKDIFDFSTKQLNDIKSEANKIHPQLLIPISRITQIDDSLKNDNLLDEYQRFIEPHILKFHKDLRNKINEYLYYMADEFLSMGISLGTNLKTSDLVCSTDEFKEIYKTSDFFAMSPFSDIILSVEDTFKCAFLLKPFWKHEREFIYNNNSFRVYPDKNNVSYINQITNNITSHYKITNNYFERFSNLLKRRDAIPYKTIMDICTDNLYYSLSTSFEKVINDLEDDMTLHEVLYCIKTDKDLYDKGRSFTNNIKDYL